MVNMQCFTILAEVATHRASVTLFGKKSVILVLRKIESVFQLVDPISLPYRLLILFVITLFVG